eukprot:TRINITY_DN75614_c0_g1_i1.p1 TRINITY_DN75614_c0_g1~~TRINITY_DN75614_c0_g1_i1.p1  ORF type:complete len:576 (-),score=106.13 TRINITY_DN75614_c0_g1_i1:102-1589(-)
MPPTADGEGRLIGAWCECLSSSVVFEITNPNWGSFPGYEDGAGGQIMDFCQKCGYDISLLMSAEDHIRSKMEGAEGDEIAFLRNYTSNGRTWKHYCADMEPAFDKNGFIRGAWGECLTAAVIFEHQNPEWSKLPMYSADGPAGQVIRYFLQCGHEPHEEQMNRTEQATHEAIQNNGEIPVFDRAYQTYIGQEQPNHINEPPPSMTGRKKALLVGCNYPGSRAELGGCINDTASWREVLTDIYGFNPSDITVLTDDQHDFRKRPTLNNMRQGLCWLVAGAVPGDVLFWQFSGHGSQQESWSNTESDGLDEVLCPTDYEDAGMLVDDEIFDLVVRPLESGVKLTIILDCCHSGTAVDLPFIWHDEGNWEEVGGTIYTAGDVQMFSGCEDAQTSADVSRHGRRGGAMTMAMTDAIKEEPGRNYPELLYRLRDLLQERGMEQYPRLTSSQKFDPRSKRFDLTQGAVPNMNPHLGSTGPPRHFQQRQNAGYGGDEECVIM